MHSTPTNSETDGATDPSSVPTPLPSASTPLAPVRVEETPLPEGASTTQDNRQDTVMAILSTDGRPPSVRQRLSEWRWFGIGAIVILAGIVCWIVIQGVSLGVVVVALVLGVLLLVSATPVLAAGLLRGKEERVARKIARVGRRGN